MLNVVLISLGCDKNRIDSEHALYSVISAGDYAVSDVADADIIIVNTCAFIESARQESIDTILECAQLKNNGRCKKLIVTGCLPQKYRKELEAELPEVDCFLGAFEYGKLARAIAGEQTDGCDDDFSLAENKGRLLTTPPHFAYIKVAEGCNNKCTFCTIPSIRGAYRSRSTDDIVAEAEGLVRDGVKELILVAQDVTRYGQDNGGSLVGLLRELIKLPVTVRLMYCYPECVTDELIELIASSDRIAKYIDIPVQHGSDKILKLMNRRTTCGEMQALINKLHTRGIVVRTTLMVGFPGETQTEFDELCEFVRRTKPEYAGIFAYSKEEGTPAARLKGGVTKSEKSKRVRALGRVCAEVTRSFNQSLVGETIPVVYEDIDFDKKLFVGRALFQAPGVDGLVYFKGSELLVGNTYNVGITGCDDYDLYGKVVDR